MTPNRAKVSILVPSLNSRRFLEERVESLIHQTYDNWEAIVLDSQSTDGTWEFFKSVAERDSRFQLHQVPPEGLYAALNRGLELATGEFVYIAPCDDTMAPEFLAQMIEMFERCPEAGIAVCDCVFINQNGNELRPEDMSHRLSNRQITNLLNSGSVRSSRSIALSKPNYRPPPHDCLLHFSGRSVYFSLTQLLIRRSLIKQAGGFEIDVGPAADFGWLLRLTSLTGTVHLPKKLATWRFHGDQISLRGKESRLPAMEKMCQRILPTIRQRYPALLTDKDCELLLLPIKTSLSRSLISRIVYWLRNIGRGASAVAILKRNKLFPRELK
ncbi:MAG TPA: glycosyltransferase [Chthoniobacterales bacterium]|nr:glycosyltransferase [Chthoniobacterales bacterium]